MIDPSPQNVLLQTEKDNSPEHTLSRIFGFKSFRGLQAQAIQNVMDGKDTLLLMPTGGGKSICYQIPALCRPGMGLVISPLIALMDDQVAALRQLGVNAGALHSELEEREAVNIRQNIINGKLDILYVSPERLLTDSMMRLLRGSLISVIAIDEAHCVSVWGHDFRPEYRDLAFLSEYFPNVPRIALTATADPMTRDDILKALEMPKAEVLRASFHRPNLYIRAIPKSSESKQLQSILQRHPDQATIIYCGSRNKAERVANSLKEKGYSALPYHAGLSALEKRAALIRFRSGEPIIIVATIAFGMGIDRPDVRLVVHLDMPGSPESYYQQIGRAGRDGDPAETVLLYGAEDIVRARYWLDQSSASNTQKQISRDRLEMMVAFSETTQCRTQVLLRCFGEELPEPCGHCDNCQYPSSLFNGTVAAQKVLSAVYRTGQRFGALHIVNVLRGKKNSAIERNQHDKLALFGIGKDKSDHFWRMVIRQLMTKDALRKGVEHSNIFLNQKVASPLLRGEDQLYLREEKIGWLDKKQSDINRVENTNLDNYSQELFDALKEWRLVEARKQAVPPYIIFHDSVLRDIARYQPLTLQNLANIRGLGDNKLEKYGEALLAILVKFQPSN